MNTTMKSAKTNKMGTKQDRIIYVCMVLFILLLTGVALYFTFVFKNPRDFNAAKSSDAFSLAVKNDPTKSNIVSSAIAYDAKTRKFTNMTADGKITIDTAPVNPKTGLKIGDYDDNSHGELTEITANGFSVRGINGGRLISCPSEFKFNAQKGTCERVATNV